MSDDNKTIPTALNKVEISDVFWAEYQRLVREVVIPYQWEALNDRVEGTERSHAVENFKIAAGLTKGEYYGVVFQDSDLAKWIEAVSCCLETHPDEKLESIADEVIDTIEKAQCADGYLNTYFTLKEPEKRWTNLHDCHELYCAGHMLEAAVAYYNATGKHQLLDVMRRFVDYIDTVFGPEPEKLKGYPGHQELELALLKLYRVTGDDKYLKLSKYFLSQRGKKPYYFDIEWEKRGRTDYWVQGNSEAPSEVSEYNQSHLSVYEQTAAVGHAVRAMYMYTAMADLAGETGDSSLFAACRRLWDNVVNRQMYITGGIGSTSIGEAFTFDYDLPNDINYAETCASIGLIFFASRMLCIEPSSEYADVIERALYNTVIASMARDGRSFFYVNPLEVWPDASEKNPTRRHVKPVRQPWFACACCPPNLARLISSLGQYIYTSNRSTIYCHLYIGSKAEFGLCGGKVVLSQQTDYPWNGNVDIDVGVDVDANSDADGLKFTLALRLPGWCRFVTVKVNGEIQTAQMQLNGYLLLDRVWKSGDKVNLVFDMIAELVEANPNVRADAGKVAVMRGPIIYCLEEVDNGANLSAILINTDNALRAVYDENLLGGAVVIHGKGLRTDESDWGNNLYRPFEPNEKEVPITAIPYFLWGNRGLGEMQTWIRYR